MKCILYAKYYYQEPRRDTSPWVSYSLLFLLKDFIAWPQWKPHNHCSSLTFKSSMIQGSAALKKLSYLLPRYFSSFSSSPSMFPNPFWLDAGWGTPYYVQGILVSPMEREGGREGGRYRQKTTMWPWVNTSPFWITNGSPVKDEHILHKGVVRIKWEFKRKHFSEKHIKS